MANLITLSTSRFRREDERPNPINPIGGEAVLKWLRGSLTLRGYEMTEPEPEDWGWYVDVHGPGGPYAQ